jgi:phosphohistidine swiveling domain-containing protein
MPKITDVTDENIAAMSFGGKAVGLSLLSKNGFQIPETIFIEACMMPGEIDDSGFQNDLKTRLDSFCIGSKYNVAIRSSSTSEDTFSYSMAGRFKSILGNNMSFADIIQGIKDVIISLDAAKTEMADAKMGIIIQQKIDADFSGVLFSSDPLTYCKRSMVFSYIAGLGDVLVSGTAAGKDIAISVQGSDFVFEPVSDLNPALIENLCQNIKRLEQKLNYPVDIEWAIKDGELFYLQCRPLTSITKIPTILQRVNEENLKQLPQQLIDHDKIELRLMAQRVNILISDAYVYICNICNEYIEPTIVLEKSKFCKGYSMVIIYPNNLSNKVIRSFVGDKQKVYSNVLDCCRYGIRSFPKYENILDCLNSYSKIVSEEYWISTTIIQEVFDPLYTGLIKQIQNGFLVEITRGHFLTKGVVLTSQYTIENNDVTARHEIEQREWYKIIEGHVIFCVCNENEDALVSLSDENLHFLIDYFRCVCNYSSSVVEFGVIKNSNGTIQPYLIDFVDDCPPANIAPADISTGVISRGKVTGVIMYISEPEIDSLDLHFYDGKVSSNQTDKAMIFFCRNPNIALLSLLETYDNKSIGFVFEDGSVLCHFAVILRERNIPAVKIGSFKEYEYPSGRVCTIDAETANIIGKERVHNE